jgi:hypothetical protein
VPRGDVKVHVGNTADTPAPRFQDHMTAAPPVRGRRRFLRLDSVCVEDFGCPRRGHSAIEPLVELIEVEAAMHPGTLCFSNRNAPLLQNAEQAVNPAFSQAFRSPFIAKLPRER